MKASVVWNPTFFKISSFVFFYNDLVLHAQVSVSVLRFAFPEGEV